jgi:sulfiredoxin
MIESREVGAKFQALQSDQPPFLFSAERDGDPSIVRAVGLSICYLRLASMMKRETFAIAEIYVPVKRRATLEQKRVDEIAASMLDNGQQTPILVRPDGARFVLVEGLHRLEAAKALGEKTIIGFRVAARKH